MTIYVSCSLVGPFGRGPLFLVNEFALLDTRFWPTQDAGVTAMGVFELVAMGPLAFFWYGFVSVHVWF